jgi:histidinol-phosphate phosphatase family protein
MSDGLLSKTTAMILAGGLGTRLRSVVADRPKILALVLGRPFITPLLDRLAAQGIRRAILCTGFKGEQVREALGDSYGPIQLLYSQETEPLGTAGAFAQALPLSDDSDEPILAMNGDAYCAADLCTFAAFHFEKRASASLLLVHMPDTSRYGRVTCDPDGRVKRFDEKTPNAGPGDINAGIYLLSREFLRSIPRGRAVSIERETFPAWIGRGLFGCRAGTTRFIDIGTPESYAQAESYLRPGRRFVLLDRDGTIIVERNYLSDPAGVELLPNAAAGLRRMAEMNLGLVTITNQSGIGRGMFDVPRLDSIHARMNELLAREGVKLDGIYYCPHVPADDCSCRKPSLGMLTRATAELNFDPAESFMIGDKPCDVEMGLAAGATTILVRSGYGNEYPADEPARPHHVAADLLEAADVIAKQLRAVPA